MLARLASVEDRVPRGPFARPFPAGAAAGISHTVAHTVGIGLVRRSADVRGEGLGERALFYAQKPTPAYFCSLGPAGKPLTVNQRVVGSSPTSGAT